MKINPYFYLFVDDERHANFLEKTYPKIKKGVSTIPDPDFFEVARTVKQAKELVSLYGFPAVVSMDNDLGENEPEGYEFVRWLIEQDVLYDWMTEDFTWIVHSMNPINSKKMMDDFTDHYTRKFRR